MTAEAFNSVAAQPVPILQLQGISRTFGGQMGVVARTASRLGLLSPPSAVHAVDNVTLEIGKSEVVGVVGESGCGKSTLGRIAVGAQSPSAGKVLWYGEDVSKLPPTERNRVRLRGQMIFQNPFASLQPRMTVADIVGEAPKIHGLTGANKKDYIDEQLLRAGLDPALRRRYPHQLSGGQRQRVGIARALAVRPELLVCDEAVAALDVSIQAQIINLFMELRDRLNLSYLFISHNLGVVEHISDRVAIMYLGRVVEMASSEDIFTRPNHPYTKALISEIPRIETTKRQFSAIKGELPSPLSPPTGCHFHPRCPFAMPRCRHDVPALREVASRHVSACHLNDLE